MLCNIYQEVVIPQVIEVPSVEWYRGIFCQGNGFSIWIVYDRYVWECETKGCKKTVTQDWYFLLKFAKETTNSVPYFVPLEDLG